MQSQVEQQIKDLKSDAEAHTGTECPAISDSQYRSLKSPHTVELAARVKEDLAAMLAERVEEIIVEINPTELKGAVRESINMALEVKERLQTLEESVSPPL